MEATQTDKACPRCRALLFAANTGTVLVLGCGGCGGVWLDNNDCERVLCALDPTTIELSSRADRHAQTLAIDEAVPVACVTCGALMVRSQSPAPDVLIDTCAEHGTWFDRAELTRVAAALAQRRLGSPLPPLGSPLPPLPLDATVPPPFHPVHPGSDFEFAVGIIEFGVGMIELIGAFA